MRAKQDARPDSIIIAFDKVNNTHNNVESGIQSGAYLQLVFYHTEDKSELYKINCEGICLGIKWCGQALQSLFMGVLGILLGLQLT